jgi:HTH-type transcriptional regulator / antitoxin HigA
MHIITRKRLNEFAEKHPDTKAEVLTVERIWPLLAVVVCVPHTESDYQRLVTFLDSLIDLIGEEENHPLAPLMEVVAVLIEKYEDDHVPHLAEA